MATLAELFSTAYHSAKENALRQRAQEAQENYWQRLLEQQAEELALGEKRLDHIKSIDERNFQYQQDRDAKLDEIREQEFEAAREQWEQEYELRKKAAWIQWLTAGTQAGYLNLAREKHKAEMDLINQQRRFAELIQNFEFMGTQPPYPPVAPEPVTIGSLFRDLRSKFRQISAERDEKYVVDMLNSVTAFEPKTPEELTVFRNTRQYAVVRNTLLQIYDYINNNKNLSSHRVRNLKAMAQIKGRRLGFDLESEYNAALNAQQQPTE